MFFICIKLSNHIVIFDTLHCKFTLVLGTPHNLKELAFTYIFMSQYQVPSLQMNSLFKGMFLVHFIYVKYMWLQCGVILISMRIFIVKYCHCDLWLFVFMSHECYELGLIFSEAFQRGHLSCGGFLLFH